MNRASRFNRNMMFGMALMAIVLLACVYTFLYMSFPNGEKSNSVGEDSDSLMLVIDTIADSGK